MDLLRFYCCWRLQSMVMRARTWLLQNIALWAHMNLWGWRRCSFRELSFVLIKAIKCVLKILNLALLVNHLNRFLSDLLFYVLTTLINLVEYRLCLLLLERHSLFVRMCWDQLSASLRDSPFLSIFVFATLFNLDILMHLILFAFRLESLLSRSDWGLVLAIDIYSEFNLLLVPIKHCVKVPKEDTA